jgi:pantoate--beta-alanine ligase
MTSTPLLAPTREALQHAVRTGAEPDHALVLVPTMGALHEGHASLFRVARERAGRGKVVASVFVNPLQFGPGEDFDRYPRTVEADLALCAREGVDVVFAPSVDEVYPGGDPQVTVDAGPLGSELEGASRPGHFAGVLTVVAKLFGLVRPDVGVFGQKDYQQLVLIRQMSRDLCLGVDVVGVETVRETDGLALSSRNRYLDATQRSHAVVLSRALRAAQDAAASGARAAEQAAQAVLATAPDVEVDYLAVRSADLGPVPVDASEPTEGRVLVAARVGSTRLIDNLPLLLTSLPR